MVLYTFFGRIWFLFQPYKSVVMRDEQRIILVLYSLRFGEVEGIKN